MVAKGKDASELFPAVVKNVVSKNIEVSGYSSSNHAYAGVEIPTQSLVAMWAP